MSASEPAPPPIRVGQVPPRERQFISYRTGSYYINLHMDSSVATADKPIYADYIVFFFGRGSDCEKEIKQFKITVIALEAE